MKEMINEVKGVVESGVDEISVMNKKLSEISGMVEMMKAGVNSDSIEAVPCMCDMVLKNIYEIIDTESVQLGAKFCNIMIYLDRFNEQAEKPKRTRRPRTPKPKDEVKAVGKETKADKKPAVKKVEPIENKTEQADKKADPVENSKK